MHQPEPSVESLTLADDGTFPNNALPVLLYRNAIPITGYDPALPLEKRFRKNGWGSTWRNGIFDFHHFHATAHEVLGCSQGWVKIQLGGPQGREVTLQAGDVVVLPAGTAHKNLVHGDDYRIVGAYPPDQSPDMCYGNPGERPQADRDIANVDLPETDPVFGEHGPLRELWNR